MLKELQITLPVVAVGSIFFVIKVLIFMRQIRQQESQASQTKLKQREDDG
jgi:hypothetical protein